MNLVVLGGTGMLGDAMVHAFQDLRGQVFVSSRYGTIAGLPDGFINMQFDAESVNLDRYLPKLVPGDFIINCIGIIKSEIDERDARSRSHAQEINSAFPNRLAKFAENRGLKVIQIATDCVYSGKKGGYSESDLHDPVDSYGSSKSAGEVASSSMMHLRVSIIGRERRNFTSLYEWVARQDGHAHLTGYTNHRWNGIPAKHFAKISRAVIETGLFQAGTHHIVPRDNVTKADLLRLIARHSHRADLVIDNGLAPESIDRTLVTNNPLFNSQLWLAAGYSNPPLITELVDEI